MRISRTLPAPWSIAGPLIALLAVVAFAPAAALAAGQAPQWTVAAYSSPTNLPPEGTGLYRVTVTNTGGAPVGCTGAQWAAERGAGIVPELCPESSPATNPITVADTLPAGLKLGGGEVSAEGSEIGGVSASCTGLTCEFSGTVVPGDALILSIPVMVEPGVSRIGPNVVTVSGGGAAEASVSTPTTISSKPAGFGVAPGSVVSVLSSSQAGAHADLTTSLAFNTVPNANNANGPLLAGNPRSEVDDLPPGFAGDLADTPTCSIAQFSEEDGAEQQTLGTEVFACPLSTQVGTMLLRTIGQDGAEHGTFLAPVFNLAPNPGEVAKLGFFVSSFGIQGEVFLRPGDDGVRTSFLNDPDSILEFESFQLTVWGVPAEPANNAMRGVYCQNNVGDCKGPGDVPGGIAATSPPIPYLTSPTQCSEPLQAALTVTSWEPGDEPEEVAANTGVLTGCNLLEFNPAIVAAPDTSDADTPAGLTADVKEPQEGLTSAEGLSSGDLQDTTVTLPEGVVINPGQAAGLQACQEEEEEIGVAAPTKCPNASIVGHDEIRTPLLKEKLEGDVYVLQSNPPEVKLLVEAAQPVYGIYIKLIGTVHLNTATGQLTTTFEGTPELPFTDFKLSFSGGAQAALTTPTLCGDYRSGADFTPWSSPITEQALSNSEFAITNGTDGAACPSSPLPFTPQLIAGATTDQAGGYTDFSLLLSRPDDQQRIAALQFKAPEGLTGFLSTVPLCTNTQAEANACPEASKIGHTVVEAGPGPYPLVIPQPGQEPAPIYLTEAYDGAPFGLSIVVPLHVGPFTLPTQRVRARIEVNPYTSALTVTTNELPQVVAGVPTDLREVDAVIERPGFMVNPTNCDPQEFTGTAYGTPPPGQAGANATAAISSHFQVGACRALDFKPQFSVSTSGKTSKADGASLTAKVSYPNVTQGTDADIAKVKVELPKQLPSRLTTLQKACTDAQFEANPAACPAASKIGYATIHTPLLPVPLTGPAIFVSHGGEAFPSLTMVLQGDGVTVDLVGTTFISKAGITSTTFKTVPDDPFSSFELTLPEGPYSALAANANLCTTKLAIPSEFIAQNGAEIHETTAISVEGCGTSLSVVSSKVKKRTLTLSVYAPGAGKVTASGKGVSSASKSYSTHETLTFTLKQKKAGKLATKIKLTFTPAKGKKQAKSLSVKFKK